MKHLVRMGSVEDQAKWRRDDLLKIPPDERVQLLIELQNRMMPDRPSHLERVVEIKRYAETT